MALFLKLPAIPFPVSLRHGCSLQFRSTATPSTSTRMALSPPHSVSFHTNTTTQKLPILLFDIMDTVVRDPFYHDIPNFFRMSFEELIECKHPNAWIEFEKGIIDEMELARKFFSDGRPLDLEGKYFIYLCRPKRLHEKGIFCVNDSFSAGLKYCMRKGYSYVEGIEELLHSLKDNNYEMHAFTNYPIWYEMIEDKLNISKYLSWTFCSCISGKRKPDPDSYLEVVRRLKVDPASCIFVDDRMRNVEAAKEIGIIGLHFKNTDLLRQDLSLLGIGISTNQTKLAQE